MDALGTLLSRPEVRIVVLTGPGGVGKTRLALEVAGRADAAFRHGVLFVPLAPIRSPEAHQQDLAVQEKYGVRSLKYWFDSASDKVFCLVEAPSPDAAIAVHREAHGMLPDEILEVEEGI